MNLVWQRAAVFSGLMGVLARDSIFEDGAVVSLQEIEGPKEVEGERV